MKTMHSSMLLLLIMAVVVLGGCGGSAKTVAEVAQSVQSLATESAGPNAELAANQATATVSARSLRVRAGPSGDAEVVTGIKEGEQYPVLSLSSDGEWVQLAIPKAPGGKGWVSTNFVTVKGSITDIGTTEVKPGAPKKPAAQPAANLVATPAAGTALVRIEGVRLRVRAEPNAEAKIVGYAFDGDTFPVQETTTDGKWVKIGGRAGTDNPDGGWVAGEFVVIGQ